MDQRWAHLLFLHWSWDAAVVQRTLPCGLTVDTFEGRAWLGPSWDDRFLQLAGFDPAGRAPDHRCTVRPVAVEIFPPTRA